MTHPTPRRFLPLAFLLVLLLCASAPAQTGADGVCVPSARLLTGQTLTASTADPLAASRMDSYPGSDLLFPGPELTYFFQPVYAEWVQATLSATSAPLSLILLKEADLDRCRAADARQVSPGGSLIFLPEPGARYYVVVDGAAPADFTLTLDCPGCAAPRPWLDSYAPARVFAPQALPQTLALSGGGFSSLSQASLDGVTLATRYLSANQLEVTLPAQFLQRAGAFALTVSNPGSPSRQSAPLAVRVEEPANTCAAAVDLLSGVPDTRGTAAPGSQSRFRAYAGLESLFPGPEFVYRVRTPGGGRVRLSAVSQNAIPQPSPDRPPLCLPYQPQPVLIVLPANGRECDPARTVAAGSGDLTWDADPGAEYFVVVESPVDAPLRYSLTFTGADRLPEEGGAVTQPRPLFDWPDVPGAERYQLQLSRQPDGSAPFHKVNSVQSQASPGVNLTGSLYWQVSAYAGGDLLSALPAWALQILPVPTTPKLTAPAEAALVRGASLTLDWSSVTLPRGVIFVQYEVQVAADPAFTPPLVVEERVGRRGSSMLQVNVNGLPPNTRLYWRVRAVGSQGAGGWSTARSIQTVLAAPAVYAPTASQILTQPEVLFLWDPTPGASSYTLEISATPKFTRLLSQVTTAETAHTLTLTTHAALYYRLRANPKPGSPLTSPWSPVGKMQWP